MIRLVGHPKVAPAHHGRRGDKENEGRQAGSTRVALTRKKSEIMMAAILANTIG